MKFTAIMRKITLTLVLIVSTVVIAYSQFPGGGRPGGGRMGGQNMNVGHFYGKLVDAKTNKPVADATVQLIGNKFDTATKKMKEVIFATVLAKPNGDFSIENLPVFGNFKLIASAIGYKNLNQTVSFNIKFPSGGAAQDPNFMKQMRNMVDKDLGKLKMDAEANDLGNVTLSAPIKQQFEMGIDRKIFNVDKNLESTGQTATEVMKNIPSVNVDIDGNVTLRNATPTIFIDDRPTTLTLDQIPADIIDRIEIITNPSAKYDASGGNAGIINIILKKNKKVGYNGGVRAGVDSYGKLNGGRDFNVRQGKINAFINLNYNQRKFKSDGTTNQNNFFNPPSVVNSSQNAVNNGEFKFLRGGFDFLADNRNTFTLAGNYVKGQFNSTTDLNLDSTINSIYTANNQGLSTAYLEFQNTGAQLSYKHNFAKNWENLTADINYNASTNNNNSYNNIYTYFPNTTAQKQLPLLQQTITDGSQKYYTFQSDYENPISDSKKFEAGIRAAIRDFGNNSIQSKYNNNTGNYEVLPGISNNYKFNDQVYAAYINYKGKVNKLGYQIGLRAESSNYTGTLLNSKGIDSATFSVKYPISLFPSAFLTYKLTDKQDLQINYSRRVNRPNFFQLIPFPNYTNYPVSVSVGNPGLNPEFTNSMELSYNNAYKPKANFLATLYFKYSTNLITQYIYRGKDQLNPGSNDSIYYSTYINANSAVSYGLELTNNMPVTKWWDLLLNLNLFNSKINAGNINANNGNGEVSIATNSILSYFAKINSNFKLGKGISLQISGNYQSKTVLPQNNSGGGGPFNQVQTTAQGYLLPRWSIDAAIRKDWTWKKGQSGSLTLGMNDIFRTNYQEAYSEQIGLFNQDNRRISNPQLLRLTFSYRFGKSDASLFKRKNLKSQMPDSGGMDMMGGGN
jgi:outer membrane receptor protein involved in Fe transport